MKLVCTISIVNRQLTTLSVNNKQKYSRSTLALCKHPKKDIYYIIFFNNHNKNGTKYEVNGNISSILTKFLKEGKATVQFKEPPHDFYIQADIIPLQCFLHALKHALLGTLSEKEITYSSLSVTRIPLKNMPMKKLVIRKRSDYPTKGFPRTIEILHINDIGRCSLDNGILKLTKLKILDLSNNRIKFLPEEFCNLPNLCELNLSRNLLGTGSPKQWLWIHGMVGKSLRQLNLCHNHMKFLPDSIIKCYNLITINVDHNYLKSLPSGIGNLVNLKTFTVSYNFLQYLPGSAKKWKLENIDLSHNQFSSVRPHTPPFANKKSLHTCTLKEYSAKTVLYYHLHYSVETLPSTLIHYLDLAKYCNCGKACFDVFIQNYDIVYLYSIAKNYIHSSETTTIPIICYFCSLRCFSDSRMRFPFT